MYIADFICYDKIIVELKSLSTLSNEHYAQVLNYLKATNYKLGLMINFGKKSLEYKRMIISDDYAGIKESTDYADFTD
jgi:GxxExxY protein